MVNIKLGIEASEKTVSSRICGHQASMVCQSSRRGCSETKFKEEDHSNDHGKKLYSLLRSFSGTNADHSSK